jgi:hypothetical protein
MQLEEKLVWKGLIVLNFIAMIINGEECEGAYKV